jgi:glycosyltransferase involved in cell wall biosynthesis
LAILDGVDDAELANLLDGADFSIYPSEYEGYGLPVVEALSRQRPVIASNVGIVPELHSPLLRRVPAGDQNAWLDAIRDWMLSPPDTRGAQTFQGLSWHEAASVVFAKIKQRSPGDRLSTRAASTNSQ